MSDHDPQLLDLLTLSMVPNMGPVLIARAIHALGSAEAVLSATAERLRTVPGIGPQRSGLISQGRAVASQRAAVELARCRDLGVTLLGLGTPTYPPLLAQTPDAPPILYMRGTLDPAATDRFTVAIVGSRECTPYGVEQSQRFAAGLAQAGLTVVSGGARGIDSAAHRAAVRIGGRTIAILGSGVNVPYPPENAELFAQIADDHGAVVSELPLDTQPAPENFPARNRIIAGLALGVIVIEAGRKSGALITARLMTEDLGREVFAVPGRVDSASSEGSLDLLKAGSAHLVTTPADVLDLLREPARHLHGGTHADRFPAKIDDGKLFGHEAKPSPAAAVMSDATLTDLQRRIVTALSQPRTVDELCEHLGADPAALRADLTMLELRRKVVREGSRMARRG